MRGDQQSFCNNWLSLSTFQSSESLPPRFWVGRRGPRTTAEDLPRPH